MALSAISSSTRMVSLSRISALATVWRSSQARCWARSMRRPRSMNSQLGPRVMFSAANPDSAAARRTSESR